MPAPGPTFWPCFWALSGFECASVAWIGLASIPFPASSRVLATSGRATAIPWVEKGCCGTTLSPFHHQRTNGRAAIGGSRKRRHSASLPGAGEALRSPIAPPMPAPAVAPSRTNSLRVISRFPGLMDASPKSAPRVPEASPFGQHAPPWSGRFPFHSVQICTPRSDLLRLLIRKQPVGSGTGFRASFLRLPSDVQSSPIRPAVCCWHAAGEYVRTCRQACHSHSGRAMEDSRR